MPPKVLTTQPLSDADADAALVKLPPMDDAALVAVRNLQAQITALTARVVALEEA